MSSIEPPEGDIATCFVGISGHMPIGQTVQPGFSRTITAPLAGLIDPRDGHEIEAAWLNSVRSRHTRVAYRADLDQFYSWCLSQCLSPALLSRADADRFRDWLSGPQPGKNGRYGAATVARKLTAISSLYKWVRDERPDVIAANPFDRVSRPRPSRKSRTRHLSVDEGDALLDAAASHSPVAMALVDLMLSTGLRTTEAITASVSDLYRDGDDDVLRVIRKGGEEDDVFVPPGTALALREYLGDRTDGPLFVFPTTGDRAVSRQQVQYLVAKLARTAGLMLEAGQRFVSPHSLRHTAATQAFNRPNLSERNVQHMMGHRDGRTTSRYDGGTVEASRAASRELGELWHRDRTPTTTTAPVRKRGRRA